MDLLRQGAEWLDEQRYFYCSSVVEYRTQSGSKNVFATFARTSFDVATESGLTINSHVWDFLIDANELGTKPMPGDVIVADSRKFEVMNLGSEGCWSWCGPYRSTYKIHTKDIGND